MTEQVSAEVVLVPTAGEDGPVMRSPVHARHAALGATFGKEAGWEVPLAYRSIHEAEHLAGDIGICDITARGKIDVRGAIGPVLAEGAEGALTARISDTWALVLTPPDAVGHHLADLEGRAKESAMVTDVTHLYAGFALAGPRVADLLARLTGFDAGGLEKGSCAGAPLAQVRSVLVRRELPGDVVEAYVGFEFGRYVWDALLDVARSLGGGPAGWDALRAWGWTP